MNLEIQMYPPEQAIYHRHPSCVKNLRDTVYSQYKNVFRAWVHSYIEYLKSRDVKKTTNNLYNQNMVHNENKADVLAED